MFAFLKLFNVLQMFGIQHWDFHIETTLIQLIWNFTKSIFSVKTALNVWYNLQQIFVFET